MSFPLHRHLVAAVFVAASTSAFIAAPRVSRLTPPSSLFSFGDPQPPVIARFLPGQRFDLQATISPDAGQTIVGVQFYVDDDTVPGPITLVRATVTGLPANTVVATLRAYANFSRRRSPAEGQHHPAAQWAVGDCDG